MAEYEALIQNLRSIDEYDTGYAKLIYDAADAIEELRDRNVGKWLFWQDDPDANVYECSACHEPLTLNEGTPRENNFNFCPFCGLPMKEGDDDV